MSDNMHVRFHEKYAIYTSDDYLSFVAESGAPSQNYITE
jgi:hypothetical protein